MMALVSQRGKELLRDEYGYVYTFNNKNKAGTKVYWVCEKRNICNVRVHTVDGNIVYRSSDVHIHAADQSRSAAQTVIAAMVNAAETTQNSTRNILSDGVQNVDEQTAAAMPSKRTLSRRIQRARRRVNPTPPIPTARHGFDIPDKYRITVDEKLFLMHDSGRDDTNRILIFCSEEGLDLLVNKRHWFCDGTFKVSPDIFYQLFSLHVFITGTVVPVLYAMLPNKTRETYVRLLTQLSHMRDFHPESILTDFETAIFSAFTDVFPDATRTGCFFHFSQCIFRQVQQHGLLGDYAVPEFSIFVRMLAALAFVPENDVITSFETLIDVDYPDRAEPILDYFEDNFIGRKDRRGVRKSPAFPVALWNISQRVVNTLPRTNNSVEGWHNGFQRTLMCSHPSLWKLIEHLQKEERLQKFSITQLLAGQTCPTKKVYRISNDRITAIVNDYHNRTILDYLRSIAYNLTF